MTRDDSAIHLHPASGTTEKIRAAAPGKSQWTRNLEANPGHTQWFIERWERMKAAGMDTDGEARLVDALVPRGALIFDAGSGTGRVGAVLHERGHRVVGVDLDPGLVEYAKEYSPGPTWIAGDLALTLELVDPELHGQFDLVVAAGNVVAFPAAEDRERIMQAYASLLKEGGRFVAGFGTARGYSLADFLTHARDAGFGAEQLFSTWDLRPLGVDLDAGEQPEFVVTILTKR